MNNIPHPFSMLPALVISLIFFVFDLEENNIKGTIIMGVWSFILLIIMIVFDYLRKKKEKEAKQ